MLTLIGDILNWTAAGVMFPLMLLPLATLWQKGGVVRQSGNWMALILGVVILGAAFAYFVPAINLRSFDNRLLIFIGFLIALRILASMYKGPYPLMQRLIGPIEAIVRTTGRAVMWLLIVMALLQFAVVVLRYVFGLNYIFMQESITYMHGAVFLLAGGYALLTDDHVRVDIFYRGASPKRKALIDLAGTYLFLVPVCLLLLWTASPYVARSWAVGEGSNESSGIQALFILKSFIPAFAVLMLMAGFVIAARAVDTLRERK
jgi:TRAP-type mannitol/chloroaromatic compound transport system permease small subunit